MPTTTITESELLEQTAELLEATFGLMALVDGDLRSGAFDDDANAREQAVAFLKDATQFCGQLLQAWPESIAA